MKAKGSKRKSSSSSHSPRTSVSPQSLARTRDKRSLKIPARFNDTEFAFSDVADALRTKGRATPTVATPKSSPSSTSSSSTSSSSTTPATTPAPSALPNATPTPAPPTTFDEGQIIAATAVATPIAAASYSTATASASISASEPVATTPTTTATTSLQIATKSTTGTASTNKSKSKRAKDTTDTSAQEKCSLLDNTPSVDEEQFGAIPPGDVAHPNTVRYKRGLHRLRYGLPLVEQIPKPLKSNQVINSAAIDTVQDNNLKEADDPVGAPKKKAKGFSLIVKPQQQQSQVAQIDQSSSVIGNITIQPGSAGPQIIPHPPTRQINGTQYGTRLLLNEPIYLPRSVGPIAPITATLPQIASQARKPPFVSKKAAACLKYQDERKLSFMTTTHSALVKIARYLGVKDRLNLRCTNKTWKSIIDCEAVWRKVLITQDDHHLDWESLVQNFLTKFKTTDMVFDCYEPKATGDSIAPDQLGNYLCGSLSSLKNIWIKSVNAVQNSAAYDIINSIKNTPPESPGEFLTRGKISWQVRVGIDEIGIAWVDFLQPGRAEPIELHTLEGSLIDGKNLSNRADTLAPAYLIRIHPI